MSPSRRGSRRRFTLILLVLASLTVLTIDFRNTGPIDSARGVVAGVFNPVRSGASWVFRPVGNLWNSAFHYQKLEHQNQKLQREVDRLRGQSVQNEVDQRQLQQFLKLARIPYLHGLPTTVAQVTSGPLTNFQDTIEIDKGAGDGIKAGMAVVTDAGLVGRIADVHGGTSTVQLITDPELSLFVRIQQRGSTEMGPLGQAHGMGPNRPLRVDDGILINRRVKAGDPVITSGIGTSTYPGQIPVAKVVRVKPSADRTQQVVDIQPYVQFDRLSYVKVILWEPTP